MTQLIFSVSLHSCSSKQLPSLSTCHAPTYSSAFHPISLAPVQELYTGSNDCQIIAWAAPRRANEEDGVEDGDNEDRWSD